MYEQQPCLVLRLNFKQGADFDLVYTLLFISRVTRQFVFTSLQCICYSAILLFIQEFVECPFKKPTPFTAIHVRLKEPVERICIVRRQQAPLQRKSSLCVIVMICIVLSNEQFEQS